MNSLTKMFDVAWTEYLLIAVVALILLGPKELPVVLRTLGRWVAKARQMTSSLEQQLYSLEDNSQASFPDKTQTAQKPAFTYQRVFVEQHLLKTQTFIINHRPAPKPWL